MNSPCFLFSLFLFVLVPLAFSPFLFDGNELPKWVLLQVGVCDFFVFLLVRALWQKGISIKLSPLFLPALGYLLLMVISTCFSSSFSQSLEVLEKSAIYFLLFLMAPLLGRGGVTGYAFLIVVSSLESIYAIFQHFGGDPLYLVAMTRSFGTFPNPNLLAGFLLMGIGMTLAVRGRWLILFPVQLLGLFFTYSRAGFAGLLLLLAFFWWLSWQGFHPPGRRELYVVAFCLVGTFVFMHFLDAGIGSRVTLLGRLSLSHSEASIPTRLFIWKQALKITASHPMLGTGPGTFSYAYLPYRQGEPEALREWIAMAGTAHNDVLEVASTQGIPALFLYLLCWVIFFKRGFSMACKGENLLLTGGFLGLVGYSLSLLFSFQEVANSALQWFFWGFLGVEQRGWRMTFSSRKWLWMFAVKAATVIAGVTLLGSVTSRGFHSLAASYHYQKGMQLHDEQDLKGSILEVTAAVRHERSNAIFFQRLGKLMEEGAYAWKEKEYWFQEALRYYKVAASLTPPDPYPHADMGRMMMEAGRITGKEGWEERGRSAYLEAMRRDPFNPIFPHDLGFAYWKAGKLALAEQWMLKGLELYPSSYSSLRDLGRLYRQQEKYKLGDKFLAKAARLYPGEREIWEELRLTRKLLKGGSVRVKKGIYPH